MVELISWCMKLKGLIQSYLGSVICQGIKFPIIFNLNFISSWRISWWQTEFVKNEEVAITVVKF